jgi:hypothetical protein
MAGADVFGRADAVWRLAEASFVWRLVLASPLS